MEKKTMGSFIAALRRAEGMTQRELAERLNVSDKSVSRWECDDGYPDITLIPVIAELFGVTADELLRGERNSPEERGAAESGALGVKGRKELERLKRSLVVSFRSRTYISIGLVALGFIAAAVCNFVFYKASLGFLLGTVFFLGGFLLEALSANETLSRDYSFPDGEGVRFRLIRMAEWGLSIPLVAICATLPLVVFPPAPHFGLQAGTWLQYGLGFALVAAVLSVTVIHRINGSVVSNGGGMDDGKAQERYMALHKMQTRMAFLLVIILMATGFLHLSMTELTGPAGIVEGTVFSDYDSFLAFVEKDVPSPHGIMGPAEKMEEVTYYDQYGNEISRLESLKRTLTDKDGNVVLEYIQRNGEVLSVSYAQKDGSILPITVRTYDDYRVGQAKAEARTRVFMVVYVLEIGAVVALYMVFKKRMK